MSIDFKDAPITNVFYDMYNERDILTVIISTKMNSHICMIDLRTLRIIKRVVKEGNKMPFIASFMSNWNGTRLFGMDRDGKVYQDATVIHDPKLGIYWNLNKFVDQF